MPNVYDLLGIKAPAAPAPELEPQAAPAAPSAPSQPPPTSPAALVQRPAAGHPWVQVTEAARQGLAPSGEPLHEALVRGGRETAADLIRLGSGFVQAPALAIPGVGQAVTALAGGGGEAAAQLVQHGEITSPRDVGIAATVPVAVSAGLRAALPAAQAVAKRLPGAAAEIQREAVATARGIAPKYAPRQSVEKLYDKVAQVNPRISMPNLRQAANDVLLEELRVAPALQGPLKKTADDLLELLAQHGDDVPFQEVRANLKRLGQRTGVVQGLEANEVRAAYKHLTDAINTDLDAAASVTGPAAGRAAATLKKARTAYRRERSVEELGEIIEGAVNKGRSDLLESFNPSRALNAINENEFLRGAFSRKELGEIVAALRGLKGLPSLPPVAGEAAIGSGRVLTRLLTGGGIGGAVGTALGGPATGGLGMAAGTLAAHGAHQIIANAIATPTGRQTLIRLLNAKGGVLDPRSLTILAQFSRGELAKGQNGEGE
jgi:hypothetical protein